MVNMLPLILAENLRPRWLDNTGAQMVIFLLRLWPQRRDMAVVSTKGQLRWEETTALFPMDAAVTLKGELITGLTKFLKSWHLFCFFFFHTWNDNVEAVLTKNGCPNSGPIWAQVVPIASNTTENKFEVLF